MKDDFLTSDVKVGLVGRSLREILSTISFVLHEWSVFGEHRSPNEKDEWLGAIGFCKLANIVCRIWSKIYKSTGVPGKKKDLSSLTDNEVDRLITFGNPFQEARGRHGRSECRFDNAQPPIYINQIAAYCSIVGHGLKDLFEVKFDDEIKKESFDDAYDFVMTAANSYRTKFKSGSVITNTKQFFRGFTDMEIKAVEKLADSLKRLSAFQIRALGTHDTHDKTFNDIKFEFEKMIGNLDKIEKALRSNNCFLQDSAELEWNAAEACRKSQENYADYERAHQSMKRELSNNQLLLDAFCESHDPPSEIWKNDIREFYSFSAKLRTFAKLLHSIAFYAKHSELRHEIAQWKPDGGTEYSHRWHQGGNPENDSKAVFIGDSHEIRPEIKERLLIRLSGFKKQLKEDISAQRILDL